MENRIELNTFFEAYPTFKNQEFHGRYLPFNQLKPELEKLRDKFEINEIGKSHLNIPIYSVKLGKGLIKILAWSQMHGNESTTTKAVMDLLNLFRLQENEEQVNSILSNCTLLLIPMLNPDGANRYTRENVNKVDLNRDAHEQQEVESRVLRECYEGFQPDYCFNLHDQRTIFGAGKQDKPATLSFLAPSQDEERKISRNRKRAMQVIAAMNEDLQKVIPGQVGRFDDAFNINCSGDTFQSLEVPTILFEAGHYPGDYLREKTREFVAFSMFSALQAISTSKFEDFKVENYQAIPENQKNFLDVILRNAMVEGQKLDIGIQFSEKMKSGNIIFEPVVKKLAPLLPLFGHREIDCESQEVQLVSGEAPGENDIVSIILLNNEKLSIKTSHIS